MFHPIKIIMTNFFFFCRMLVSLTIACFPVQEVVLKDTPNDAANPEKSCAC